MNKTVAVVGTHPETREFAPFSDPNIDIWVFNEAAGQKKKQEDGTLRSWAWRVTGVFQMHQPFIYRSRMNRSDPDHWQWLKKKHPFPIWMLDVDPEVPSSVKYPLDEISNELLGEFYQGRGLEIAKRRYFTSTIAYAFALAIYMGYDEMLIYGIEMASDTEYSYQRDCAAFWIGVALGRGIKVKMHGGQAIFNKPLYGYDGIIEQKPEDYEARAKELQGMINEARKRRSKAEIDLHSSWDTNMISENISAFHLAEHELGVYEGALDEVKKYQYKISDMWAEDNIAFIDRNEFEGAAGAAKKKMEEALNQVHRTAGHVDYMLSIWMQTKNPASLKQLKGFITEHIKASYESGYQKGIWEENFRLAMIVDKAIKAAGGEKALRILSDAEMTTN